MKKIRLTKELMLGYVLTDYVVRDCNRIRAIFLDDGYAITHEQAESLWKTHSDRYAAGWLGLPDNDDSVRRDLDGLWEEDSEFDYRESLQEIVKLYETYGDPDTPFEQAYLIAKQSLSEYS